MTAVPATRKAWLLALAAFAVFLILSIGYSLTRAPWWDEGVYADVSLTFRNYGYLASKTMAPFGNLELPGANHYVYWQMPLYMLVLGLLLKVLPATIESIRMFSVFWGCVYLASWFVFIRSLSRVETLALLVAAVVGLDYSVIAAASDGRMDMMGAALGQAAWRHMCTFARPTGTGRSLPPAAWELRPSFLTPRPRRRMRCCWLWS